MIRHRLALDLVVLVCASFGLGDAPDSRPFPFGLGASLLNNSSVWDELKLSDSQRTFFRVLGRGIREEQFRYSLKVLGGGGVQESNARLTKSEQQTEKEIFALLGEQLKDDQLKRFKQIWIQQKGIGALFDPQVSAKLALTAEQTRDISTIASKPSEPARIGKTRPSPFDVLDDAPLRKKALEAALAVLDKDQRKNWNSLVGRAFLLKDNPPEKATTGEPLPIPPAPARGKPEGAESR